MSVSHTTAEVTSDAPALDPAPAATSPPEGVCCPLCEYDLRGLTEPRCPECGYTFTWPDVLDPDRRLHPYLFEHHPERNAWAFRRTLLGGLRPGRFWEALRPAQPGRPRRLVVYWLLAAVPMLLAAAAWNVERVVQRSRSDALNRAALRRSLAARASTPGVQQIISQFGSLDAYLDASFPARPPPRFFYRPGWLGGPGAVNGVVFVWLAWPWLTFVTLLLFRFSMRRARIRPIHVLRCVLYSFDAVLWAGCVAAATVAAVVWSGWSTTAGRVVPGPHWLGSLLDVYLRDAAARAVLAATALLLPFMVYRLVVAYRKYLRFDRPAATVLASQVIVTLLVVVAAVNAVVAW